MQDRPNERPWSLNRNGYAGVQRYGGWIWSGDVQSQWSTLKAHVPVGVNASLSLTPFWGTDTGGFMGLRPTGKPFRLPVVWIFKVSDGQFVHVRAIYDFTGLLVQIGVLKAKPA